jgi:hypothetical protein
VSTLLGIIKKVGREGAGNVEAARAWKDLVNRGPRVLPAILAAMDDDNLISTNWLRPAVDAIAERAVNAGQPLPKADLEKFIANTRHAGVARRLAYEWLVRIDKSAPARLLPGMLKDPSPDLRRDAVARALNEARDLLDGGKKEAALAAFRKALSGACDRDQVDAITGNLQKLGVKVDLAAHFGVVRHWHLITPFDNKKQAGFTVVYPPEKGVDLSANYKGSDGKEARWKTYTTDDPYGIVDLNKVLGKQKGTVAYAFAAILSPKERTVEVRAGCINACKIFLNGKEIFAREEYHHGMLFDQYRARATLKAGRNELLIKVCQNEQTEPWAQSWSFQVRVCDFVGAAVPYKPVITSPARKEEKTR